MIRMPSPLAASPVQELVAWFDDLDPANGATIRVALEST